MIAYRKQWVKVESTLEKYGLIVYTKHLNGRLFKEGSKGYLVLMYRTEHSGFHPHNIPLMAAPVHYTNFKNFHFRKWCDKKDDTTCSSYNVVKESDSSLGFTNPYVRSPYLGPIFMIYGLYNIGNIGYIIDNIKKSRISLKPY